MQGELTFHRLLDHLSEAVERARAQGGEQSVTELLRDLIATPDLGRLLVARYRQCPPDVLVQLLADDDPEVRRAAWENPNLPEEYRVLGQVAE